MHSCGRALAAITALCAVLAVQPHAQSTQAGRLYREAVAREATLRREMDAHRPDAPSPPLLRRIRVLVSAYEDMARLLPDNDYADEVLWQGAALSADAFWQFGEAADRESALRLYGALSSRFPSSPFTTRASPQVRRLTDANPAPRVAATTPSAPAGTAILKAVRREVLPDVLRVTLDLEREVPFRDDRTQSPRVVVYLQQTRPDAAIRDTVIPFKDDVVTRMRVEAQTGGRARVVFELTEQTPHSVYALYDPYRVVIDFERKLWERAKSRTHVVPPPSPPASNSVGGFSLSRQLGLGIGRVVIDPGHGGHDPGAKVSRLTEAALVLDVALRLEKLLAGQPGVEVVLTRRADTYVALEDRTAVANESGADLFLSIHANASGNGTARGVETYFLNFAATPEAEAIAARENAASAKTMRNLPEIVKAIAMNNKIDESRDFATQVQAALYERLRRANRTVKNLGVKQAPFMVLIGATMPSALAEISFLTNDKEATLLKTERYRQQIAEALFNGVMRYQRSLKKTPVAMN